MHAINQPTPIPESRQSELEEADRQDQAKLLRLSMIPRLPKRAVAVFLGVDVSRTSQRTGVLMTQLMAECLERFVAHLGGNIVLATDFGESDECSPDYINVEIDGMPVQVLVNGFVFIELPEERVVVRFYREYHGLGDVFSLISAQSNIAGSDFFKEWKSYTRSHNYVRGRTFFADGDLIQQTRRYGWDDIVLPEKVRTLLATHVEGFLHNLPRLKAMGMKLRRGLILTGPSGTGKTLLGKVLSSVLGVSFIWVLPRHVTSPMVFQDVLELARFLSPTLIFLEDLDLFAEERESNRSSILGELMNQLDGVRENNGIVTIATTNRLEVIEQALRNRPGRFDRVLDMGAPDANCRKRLLERMMSNALSSPEMMKFLVERTDGFSGARLEELATTMRLLYVVGSDGQTKKDLMNRAIEELSLGCSKTIGFR